MSFRKKHGQHTEDCGPTLARSPPGIGASRRRRDRAYRRRPWASAHRRGAALGTTPEGSISSACSRRRFLRVPPLPIGQQAAVVRRPSRKAPRRSGCQRLYPSFFADSAYERRQLAAVTKLLKELDGFTKWQFFVTGWEGFAWRHHATGSSAPGQAPSGQSHRRGLHRELNHDWRHPGPNDQAAPSTFVAQLGRPFAIDGARSAAATTTTKCRVWSRVWCGLRY